MADPSHLEKMGRELKCPICLSLFNSAATLTCNHVFCNACIMKSMKSGSDCPVCKVPYRRREVRPAPHMDNLVSIYKSMEVASGFNIFVTQNPSLDTSAGAEKQTENDNCSERVDNKGAKQRRGSRVAKSKENSDSLPVKPSFSSNKRVQVVHYPLPETPVLSGKKRSGSVVNTEDESKMSSDIPKVNLREDGDQILSPFFWLREEEDVERPSQLTDGDQCVYTTPPELPSFSDMKDSDDDDCSNEEPHGSLDRADFFDSEMFEWTQRACSPELLPSPVKIQVPDTEEQALQGANTDEIVPIINMSKKISRPKSRKLGRKQRKTAPKIIADRTSSYISGDHVDLGKGSEDFNKEQAAECSRSSSYLAKTRENSKVAGLNYHEAKPVDTYVSAVNENAETPKQDNTQLPAVVGMGTCVDEYENVRSVRSCRKITTQSQNKSFSNSKKQKPSLANVDISKEVSTVYSHTNENMIQQKSLPAIPLAHDNGIKQVKKGSIKRARKEKLATSLECEENSSCEKKRKVSFGGDTKRGLAEDQQQQVNGNTSQERLSEKVLESSTVGISNGSTVKSLPLANGAVLHKCPTITNKIQCAFCLSTEDSEASGEMIHYYEGIPVPLDYNGGSKVIHSHKNCTEWAPNVYFENEKAINLVAELSRSKKIKCSCCGLKGAALGCYEKTCRKSFHVPCAKLVSQCRWDADNFVMLCPLHASSKFPNEKSESQGSRKRCVLRGPSSVHHNEIPINDEISVQKWNPCESRYKLVLCCSALTIEEKEIISEFEKLAGVTVLKRWDPTVTHVIASMDENGACKRTLKFLMGILEGKWILNINWVKACIKDMKPVDELPYEITIDVYGIRDGPRLGRLRLQNELPKLFNECNFYIMGDFEPSYKGYLQDMVVAAGGTILHRKPISGDPKGPLSGSSLPSTFIIYSVELPDKCHPNKKHKILSLRRSDAEALANSTEAKAVSNSWVLNSISACRLQSLGE